LGRKGKHRLGDELTNGKNKRENQRGIVSIPNFTTSENADGAWSYPSHPDESAHKEKKKGTYKIVILGSTKKATILK